MSDETAFEVRKDQPPVHQMAIPPPDGAIPPVTFPKASKFA